MILTDAQRHRHDLGPGSGMGQTNNVRVVNVGFHIEEPLPAVEHLCPQCLERIGPGRIACAEHARMVWGRRSVR